MIEYPLLSTLAYRLRAHDEPWQILSKSAHDVSVHILKHELEAALQEGYSDVSRKDVPEREPSGAPCSLPQVVHASHVYLVVGQTFTETARQSILSLTTNASAIVVIRKQSGETLRSIKRVMTTDSPDERRSCPSMSRLSTSSKTMTRFSSS